MKDSIININQIISNKISINQSDLIGVYFLIKDNEIVYVGKTENGFARIMTHIREKEKIFDSYAIFPVGKELLEQVEINNILHYRPIYNKNFFSSFYVGISTINKKCCEKFGTRKMKLIKKVLQNLEKNNTIKIIRINVKNLETMLIDKNDVNLIMKEIENLNTL